MARPWSSAFWSFRRPENKTQPGGFIGREPVKVFCGLLAGKFDLLGHFVMTVTILECIWTLGLGWFSSYLASPCRWKRSSRPFLVRFGSTGNRMNWMNWMNQEIWCFESITCITYHHLHQGAYKLGGREFVNGLQLSWSACSACSDDVFWVGMAQALEQEKDALLSQLKEIKASTDLRWSSELTPFFDCKKTLDF